MSYEALVRWNEDGSGVLPNVAKSFEISDDATEFVFHLREGMKWSDGEPFTADDVLFYLSTICRTPTGTRRSLSGTGSANDENMRPPKSWTTTFKATFQSAYGLFIQMLAGPGALD